MVMTRPDSTQSNTGEIVLDVLATPGLSISDLTVRHTSQGWYAAWSQAINGADYDIYLHDFSNLTTTLVNSLDRRTMWMTDFPLSPIIVPQVSYMWHGRRSINLVERLAI